jgi:hypothetical protein
VSQRGQTGTGSRWAAAAVVIVLSACSPGHEELPKPAQEWAVAPPQLLLPSPPSTPGPRVPVILSPSEMSAIEQLRRRGASITVFAGSGDVLVHFPLGALERRWRKEGQHTPECGMSIEYSFTPDDTGPPMTDRDLRYLEALPRLTRVNVAGTRVTASALAVFRDAHPSVEVEDRDDPEE